MVWHAARRIFAIALMIRDGIAVDEVEPYLHARAWLTDLRPEADHPERCNIVVDIGHVREVLLRVAADIDELARARSVDELKRARAPAVRLGGASKSAMPRRLTKSRPPNPHPDGSDGSGL
jgi:hypothetical protein